ncbi:MAG: hypothetical protein K2O06_04615 [Acetatifactor sp.]|nr:hypothetical protein [Acetatifactor sp.]
MKIRIRMLLVPILTIAMLTACGQDPELIQFRKSIDEFCTKVSEIDTAINSIDAQASDATAQLLSCLDELDMVFKSFAGLDFPEEFDYLEALAAESSEYMTEAVSSYHIAYSNNSYNEYTAAYAKENYSRAYKRVQIIIAFLHGDVPDDADLTVEYSDHDDAPDES